jgi:hypothetical protein
MKERMIEFNIGDIVKVVDKAYLKNNGFIDSIEGVIQELQSNSTFYKEYHGSMRIANGRNFIVFPGDCELLESKVVDKPYTINDPVNHPSHYTFGKYEVIDVLMDWFPDAPLLWQVVKYVARAKHKGQALQDLKKAQFYLNKVIESVENFEKEQK